MITRMFAIMSMPGRLAGLMVLLVGLDAGALPAEMNTPETLRHAIEYLSNAYGDRYPHGEEYLERLNRISSAASPEYKALLALPDGAAKSEFVLGERKPLNEVKKWVLENGYLINFTRPEKSPCLQHIADDEQRRRALTHIREAAACLQRHPREDMINRAVSLSEMDQHYTDRVNSTRSEKEKSIEAILSGEKYYQFRQPREWQPQKPGAQSTTLCAG